jgi:hypothetical protein
MGSITMGENETTTLVTERFELAEQVAIDQIALAETYLASLSTLFANAVMPDSDIVYDFQNITLDSDLTSNRPEAPTDEEMHIDVPADPVMGTLATISIPTITIPTYDLVEPGTTELGYTEAAYNSDLQVALKIALIDFIENGGTGLGEDVEDALWERGRARQQILNERVYDEANEFFASRGYTIPAGALSGRLTEALAEQTRADAQLNFEILIEQARLARAQSEHTINASLALEGQDKEQFNAIANRTLEAAKIAVQVIVDLYNARVTAYVAKVEGSKLTVEAEKIKVDAAVAANRGIIDAFTAGIDGFKAKLAAELGIVESIAKVYGFKIAGYEADAKVAALELDAQIKVYQAKIDQANNQTTLSLKEAEMTIQSYLGALQLTSDAIKAGGNISAQIAASALGAVNASASLGDSVSRAASSTESDIDTTSDSTSVATIHSYDHTSE